MKCNILLSGFELLALTNIVSSTVIYAHNSQQGDYCVNSINEHQLFSVCTDRQEPVVLTRGNTGTYQVTIQSGFDPTNFQSSGLPTSEQRYEWSEDYEFVWVDLDGCLYKAPFKPEQNEFCFLCNLFKFPCVPRSYKPNTFWESTVAPTIPNPYYWRTITTARDWAPNSRSAADTVAGASGLQGGDEPRAPLSSTGSEDDSPQSLLNNNDGELALDPLNGNSPDDLFSSSTSTDTTLGDLSFLPSDNNNFDQFSLASSSPSGDSSIFTANAGSGTSNQDLFASADTGPWDNTQSNLFLSNDFGTGDLAKRGRRKGRLLGR